MPFNQKVKLANMLIFLTSKILGNKPINPQSGLAFQRIWRRTNFSVFFFRKVEAYGSNGTKRTEKIN
jgi:hypothetical protein